MKFDSVEEVLDHYGVEIDYKKSNAYNFTVLCPFHNDSHASLSVHKLEGMFNCFACGETGSIIKLIMKLADCDYKTAKNMWEGENPIEFKRKKYEEEQSDSWYKFMTLLSGIKSLIYNNEWTDFNFFIFENFTELCKRQKYFKREDAELNKELQMKRLMLVYCQDLLWERLYFCKDAKKFNWYEEFVQIASQYCIKDEVREVLKMWSEGIHEARQKADMILLADMRRERDSKKSKEELELEKETKDLTLEQFLEQGLDKKLAKIREK